MRRPYPAPALIALLAVLAVLLLPWPAAAQPDTCQATPCVEDGQTLCLNGDRFRVTTRWETDKGATGAGKVPPEELTPDTSYFWFFRSTNAEMVVKVLDGCTVNGHYWVFAGGLTNVEVELEVCDTQEGRRRVYTNPQGTSFQPIQDTAAFATCP